MRKVDLIYLSSENLYYIREMYLKEIEFWKCKGHECQYVTWLENEVCSINMELVDRMVKNG